jgi:tRNA (cmo5U34)-methyltransferase
MKPTLSLPMSEDPPKVWQQPGAVAQFLDNVRGAVPLAIEQVDIMLRLISAARDHLDSFLNIGGGDGVLAAAMLDEFPTARGLLLDASSSHLEIARQRLRTHAARIDFRRADCSKPDWVRQVAALQPFDAIVCGFATHSLSDRRKREFYGEVFALLRPGGIFLNIEHVASATRWTESVFDDYLIDAIFGDQLKAASGKTRTEIAREYYARATEDAGRLAPLEVQCDWLREIGFENVDCYLKVLELAVFGGQRRK